MGSRKNYDEEYKAQAVKLANEKGGRKAAEELGISSKTLSGTGRTKSENKFSDQTVLRLSRHGVVNFESRTSRLSKPPQNCKFVRKVWS